jgi:AbrB family looped-hinge helix DNA binding protein
MKTYSVKLEKSGRILIPAEIRRRLGLQPGQDVLIRVDGDTVELVGSRLSVVRKIQEKFRRHGGNRSLSAELIAERRAEAATEEEE